MGFYTLLKNTSAMEMAVKGLANGMKWLYIVSLSTAISLVSLPSDFGRASMKSMLISA